MSNNSIVYIEKKGSGYIVYFQSSADEPSLGEQRGGFSCFSRAVKFADKLVKENRAEYGLRLVNFDEES